MQTVFLVKLRKQTKICTVVIEGLIKILETKVLSSDGRQTAAWVLGLGRLRCFGFVVGLRFKYAVVLQFVVYLLQTINLLRCCRTTN